MRIFVTLFAALMSLNAMAISEDNYKVNYDKLVKPFFDAGRTETVAARDGVELSYHKINQDQKKLVFMMAGRTEAVSKYAEVVYDLKDLGYDFLLLDSRGQGLSERELGDIQKGWVKSYKDYITDIEDLFKELKVKENYSEVVFLGHSMGAAIGLRYAEVNPGVFSKVIVNSPMIELKLDDKNETVVAMFMRLKILTSDGTDYIPDGGPTTQEYPYENNRVTHSPARFEMARNLERENSELIMGSATVKWVLEGIKMGRKTYKKRKKLFKTPMLLFQAGIEHFSRYKRQDKICAQHPKCEKVLVKEGKHELLMEKDELRDQVMTKIKAFL